LAGAPYDNVLYFPPPGSNLFFDTLGLDIVGAFSDYRFYTNAGAADPMQTFFATFDGDAVVTRVDPVPGPEVGAGLPGLLACAAGFVGWSRRRRGAA
jgi:hypothetical protein